MRIFSDFGEFKAAVGTELGASEWIEVTPGTHQPLCTGDLR